MSNNTPQRPIENIGAGPHKWEAAAKQMPLAALEDPVRRWLQESRLPGTDKIGGADWMAAERIQFLRLLCGEQD
jgi:hypothetical protein